MNVNNQPRAAAAVTQPALGWVWWISPQDARGRNQQNRR
jgi:hypothetical protein